MKLEKNGLVADLIRWQNAFLNEKKAKNLDLKSIDIYSRALEAFIEFSREFNEEMGISDINRVFVNSFANSLNLSITTKNIYLRTLKAFLAFITEENEDLHDFSKLIKNIKLLRTSTKAPSSLNDAEIVSIMRYIDKKYSKESFLSMRNAFLLKLLLFTGARVSEILSIKHSDVESDGEFLEIKIMGKGKREGRIYVSEDQVAEEWSYLQKHNSENGCIFTSKKGRVILRQEVNLMVNRIFANLGIKKSGVHIFRHSLARKLVSQNVNLSTIKDILRHSSITTTAGYYAIANEKDKKEALRLM